MKGNIQYPKTLSEIGHEQLIHSSCVNFFAIISKILYFVKFYIKRPYFYWTSFLSYGNAGFGLTACDLWQGSAFTLQKLEESIKFYNKI